MIINDIVVALIMSVPATVGAYLAWRAKQNTKHVGNGWTKEVSEALGRIEGQLDAHVNDARAHRE